MARQLPSGRRHGEGIVCAFPAADRAGEVVARFGGVVTLLVRAGDRVTAGDAVAIVELTKLEAVITAPVGGKVARIVVPPETQVDGGDLLLVIDPDDRMT